MITETYPKIIKEKRSQLLTVVTDEHQFYSRPQVVVIPCRICLDMPSFWSVIDVLARFRVASVKDFLRHLAILAHHYLFSSSLP